MKKIVRKKSSLARKDFYTIINLAALVIILIFRIPLGFIAGDKGVAYFGTANEIFLATAGVVSYGLTEAAASLVRYRIKREQYGSTRKILRGALILGGSIGVVFSIIFGFFGHILAQKVMHLPLAGLAVRLMAPAIFFFILTGVFRGYFQGNGSGIPAMHSQILYIIFLYTGGLIGTGFWYNYGKKVSALLQNEDYASAYGAMGASIGLLAASFFCFLHVLVLYFIFSHSNKNQLGGDMQKNQNTAMHVFPMLLGTGIMHSLYWFCYHIMPLLDQYIFFSAEEQAADAAGQWGAYYGKCLVVAGIISGVIHMICVSPIRRIMTSFERNEQSIGRERLGILVHQCAVFSVPAAVFLAVLAENILALLPAGNSQQTLGWMQLTSLIVVFSVFASVFMEILIRNRKLKYVIGIGAVALVLHAVCGVLLVKTAKLGIMGIIIAVIVFYAVAAVMGFLLIGRILGYRQEWLRSFAFTIAAAAISGFIALLLNRVLLSVLGAVISMLICLIVGILLYMVALVVLRSFRSGELEEMAGGKGFSLLADLLHFS